MITSRFHDQAFLASLAAATGGGGGGDVPVTANLIGQWAADKITGLSNGSLVASWPDASGNNHNAAQPNDGLKPTYYTNKKNGLPGLFFDGSNDKMDTGISSLGLPCTVFLVYSLANNYNDFQNAISLSNTAYCILGANSWKYAFYCNTTALVDGGDIVDNVVKYATLKSVSGGSDLFRVNGVQKGLTTNRVTPGVVMFGSAGYYARPMNGYMFEVLIYNAALSTGDIDSVEGYLKTKWGL